MPDAPVRRVTPGDWRRIRALRLEALRDPMAQVAFLETVERAEARPDEEWRGRTAAHAEGGASAQFGVKPLVYTQLSDGAVAFASEIKGLLAHPSFRRAADFRAVEDYLRRFPTGFRRAEIQNLSQ